MKDVQARIGRKIRDLRRKRSLTQEQLAERAGLSYKFIGEIERATGNPTVHTLKRLADALDVDVTVLFGESTTPTRDAAYGLSREEMQNVREALESLEELVARITGRAPTAPGLTYRRRRRKSPRQR